MVRADPHAVWPASLVRCRVARAGWASSAGTCFSVEIYSLGTPGLLGGVDANTFPSPIMTVRLKGKSLGRFPLAFLQGSRSAQIMSEAGCDENCDGCAGFDLVIGSITVRDQSLRNGAGNAANAELGADDNPSAALWGARVTLLEKFVTGNADAFLFTATSGALRLPGMIMTGITALYQFDSSFSVGSIRNIIKLDDKTVAFTGLREGAPPVDDLSDGAAAGGVNLVVVEIESCGYPDFPGNVFPGLADLGNGIIDLVEFLADGDVPAPLQSLLEAAESLTPPTLRPVATAFIERFLRVSCVLRRSAASLRWRSPQHLQVGKLRRSCAPLRFPG